VVPPFFLAYHLCYRYAFLIWVVRVPKAADHASLPCFDFETPLFRFLTPHTLRSKPREGLLPFSPYRQAARTASPSFPQNQDPLGSLLGHLQEFQTSVQTALLVPATYFAPCTLTTLSLYLYSAPVPISSCSTNSISFFSDFFYPSDHLLTNTTPSAPTHPWPRISSSRAFDSALS